ncbi:TIGR02680 family protein [Kitasatospora sp. NPDC058046]|uniref:TIGR02680 family protein n=1 Tax=Kitasatospora sp. NPDC058046 TaxID=3346312 RepID=UPI0036DCBF1C
MARAGILNAWYYYDQRFDVSGGRLILRGTNGSGKSRALEMLLPFVLDADRRRMDATGAGKVRLEDLMEAGCGDANVRLGYLWLELVRYLPADGARAAPGGREHLTVGAAVRFSRSTKEAKAWYFLTPLRVDEGLSLMDADRAPLSVHQLTQLVGEERITTSPDTHRERVAAQVFGLPGASGRERFTGLLQLLHTLRAPDVGNRIDEGGLPAILSDALPPLADKALTAAGEKLDGLNETRKAQENLELACRQVSAFAAVYRRYATAVMREQASRTRRTAEAARTAVLEERRQEQRRLDLADQAAHARARQEELGDYCEELQATITGIKESRAYKDARELDERQGRLEALGEAADSAFSAADSARAAEHHASEAVDEAVEDVRAAAAAADAALEKTRADLDGARLHPVLPARIAAQVERAQPVLDLVRTERMLEAAALPRPAVLQLMPAPVELEKSLTALGEQAPVLRTAAAARRDQAEARRRHARELDEERPRVEQLEVLAEQAAQETVAVEEEARAAAGRRDDAALALAGAWAAWSAGEATTAVLGCEVDWAAGPAGPLLADMGLLVGDDDGGGDSEEGLARLDAAAGWAAGGARESLAHRRALLDAADSADRKRIRALEDETQELRVVDPPPPAPEWTAGPPAGSVPLWKALEFTEQASDEDRAGLEGALLASGLLTAALGQDSTLRADDGSVLVRADGPRVLRSVRQVLAPAPDCPVPAARVLAVLDQIALDTSGSPVWIDRTGGWGNGLLCGRHRAPAARYVGAAARAAARERRLAEITAELDALESAAEQRDGQREEVDEALARLEQHLLTAPRSTALAAARREARRARQVAERARHRATRLAAEAGERQRTLQARLLAHKDACAAFSLPHAHDALLAARDAAGAAVASATHLHQAARTVRERLERLGRAEQATTQARAVRVAAEQHAQVRWTTWAAEENALAAIRESLGADAEAVTRTLTQAQDAHAHAKTDLKAANRQATDLAARAADAAARAEAASTAASAATEAMRAEARALAARCAHPGLACARRPDASPVAWDDDGPVDPAAAARLADAALDGLTDRSATADATAVLRAQNALDHGISGILDVDSRVEDGVHLVQLCNASGRRWVGDTESELTVLRDRGRAALTERERAAFTTFVLDGVAQELRDRIRQAGRLVEAMNASLATISTSHGIGVELTWSLREPGSTTARIEELLRLDPAVMRSDQQDELITLLRAEVNARFSSAPETGYAAHLRAAFDYRLWYTMEVVITGPEQGQRRRISRRAKLSQGETRFVSYVALFAAVDAYLSGLPDTGRALRLILLDDAFAKVDDRTIGELMDLLVRLDLDFVMTGHALWGFYPQVPALDVYEVRRAEGRPAVALHIHWDGSKRHLKAAV